MPITHKDRALRRFLPAKDIRVERLADLALVFHRLSGETHILSPETDAIFSAVPPGGAAADQVLETLIDGFGDVEAETGTPIDIVTARLDELAALGIVQSCR